MNAQFKHSYLSSKLENLNQTINSGYKEQRALSKEVSEYKTKMDFYKTQNIKLKTVVSEV